MANVYAVSSIEGLFYLIPREPITENWPVENSKETMKMALIGETCHIDVPGTEQTIENIITCLKGYNDIYNFSIVIKVDKERKKLIRLYRRVFVSCWIGDFSIGRLDMDIQTEKFDEPLRAIPWPTKNINSFLEKEISNLVDKAINLYKLRLADLMEAKIGF